MSYNATISFKTVEQSEIYPFFQQIKECVRRNIEAIAEDEFLYMPSIRYEHLYSNERPVVRDDADRAWAKGVFTMRFFYLAEHNLLGVFGVPDAACDIFDDSIYFQNSCDQDYEFETWEKVPVFALIAEKWKSASDEAVKAKHTEERDGEWDEDEMPDLDYYRRTFAYDEIWALCSDYMWHDESAVHLSLFGFYDFMETKNFVAACHKKYKEWNKGE